MTLLKSIQRMINLARQPVEPNRVGASRREFLRLACEIIGADSSAAFLWLYDSDRLNLGHQFTTQCTEPAPIALVNRVATPFGLSTGSLEAGNFEEPGVSLQNHPQIAEWCQQLGIAGHEQSCWFRGPSDSTHSDRQLGVIQVVSSSPLHNDVSASIPYLGDVLGLMIGGCRRQRRISTFQRMLADIDLTKPIEECFSLAVSVLRDITDAELCLIYRQDRNLGLKCVAASMPELSDKAIIAGPASVTAQMLQRNHIVRLSNFADDAERERVVGTMTFDHSAYEQISSYLPSKAIRATMFGPVVVGGHPLVVVALINKPNYLARRFSATEEQILADMCQFLAGAIPSVETRQVMVRITDRIFSGKLGDPEARESLFTLMAEMIPGTANAALIHIEYDGTANELLMLGGEEWLDSVNVPKKPTTEVVDFDSPKHHGRANEEARRYIYVAEIPNLELRRSLLAIGLRRRRLSEYEKLVIDFVCKELSQVLQGDQLAEKTLRDIVEIRHVVRAGLSGVIGHVQEAAECYKLSQQEGAAPGLLGRARFRKALERANEFALRTHAVMEASRFMLGAITPESLRVGRHSVASVAREIVMCLKPAAERRAIHIELQNHVPDNLDGVEMDRDMVYILMFNLLDNAVKYSHRSKQVMVELYVKKGHWVLTVKDFGIHIRDKDRKIIFEPFIRRPTGQAASTRPGTGLGLPVVKEIVDAHGGQITVESRILSPKPTELAETQFSVRMPRKVSLGG